MCLILSSIIGQSVTLHASQKRSAVRETWSRGGEDTHVRSHNCVEFILLVVSHRVPVVGKLNKWILILHLSTWLTLMCRLYVAWHCTVLVAGRAETDGSQPRRRRQKCISGDTVILLKSKACIKETKEAQVARKKEARSKEWGCG